jgi:hypothetical protein
MRHPIKKTYAFFVTFPDRLYPFANKVGNRRVRGMRSYEHAAARALRKHGLGRLGYKLMLYRELFHFFGSIFLIVIATLLSQRLFGSTIALYILLYAAIVALSYQEFYLHPKRYGQHFKKGVVDWLVWVIPISIYLFRL